MAKTKVKIDTRKLKANLERITPKIKRNTARFLKTEVVDFISRGISPVSAKKQKYEKYSKPYKTAIRKGRIEGKTKVSPANLTQSGSLLNSFKVKIFSGGIKLFFSNSKAVYHNNPSENSKIPRRPMLPTEAGEKFNVNINNSLREVVIKSIKQILG
jgi:hypothetical protein